MEMRAIDSRYHTCNYYCCGDTHCFLVISTDGSSLEDVTRIAEKRYGTSARVSAAPEIDLLDALRVVHVPIGKQMTGKEIVYRVFAQVKVRLA